MDEVAVINSFHNHDFLFYPINTLKSIPGISLKMAGFPDFNKEFNPLSPIFLLYYLRKLLVITGFLAIIIRYTSKFFLFNNLMITGADSWFFYFFAFLKCERCINTGEPAAVFGFPRQIKVVELILPESNAAGSLFGLSLGRG